MKLLEIIGFKSDEVFQLLQNFRNFGKIDLLVNELVRMGYSKRILGSGIYGIVFDKPNSNYVYKVFNISDKGYIKYLKFLEMYKDNPHVPKILGKPIRIKLLNNKRLADLMFVKLEKLKELPVENHTQFKIVQTINLAIRIINDFNNGKISSLDDFSSIIDDFNIYEREYPELVDLIQNLHLISENDIDLHSGNIMLRGKVPVITDPFFQF